MKRILTLVLVIITFMSLNASEWIDLNKDGKTSENINLVSSSINTSSIHFSLNGFWKNDIETDRGTAWIINTDNGSSILNNGAPDLPVFATSLIIPNQANMQVNIISAQYEEFQNVLVAPSKGNLLRTVDPSSIPYKFGKQYSVNSFYPDEVSSLREPYIVRDFRAQTVLIKPIQYNPITKVLRVYYDISIEVIENGISTINTLPSDNQPNVIDGAFQNIYARHFLNYDNQYRYTPVSEMGNMLIISYADFMDEVQPLIDWKIKSGTPVEIVDVATIGNASAIKQFIADYYNDNGLTFVLLVGDSQQVPSSSNGGNDSDVNYSYIVGNDHYPDLFVGRFSAETEAQVITQVTRTLDYEINPITDTDWFTKAIGIASSQGTGDDNEYDYEHIRNIGNKLISFTYDYAYEFFDGSQGGNDAAGNPSSSMVAEGINSGATIINYTGHGSTTSWSTSGFSSNNVNNLTNNGKLPFVIAVACVNGNFVNSTCFAEAWLRAENNSEPAGAIATFMSTINQSWDPPMRGQDEMNDILTEAYSDNIKRTFGGITMNGCMNMNDVYGSGGYTMTDTWTIFGDPSLEVRTAAPQDLTVTNPSTIFLGSSSTTITCDAEGALATLSMDGEILGSAIVEGGSATITFTELSSVGTADFVVTAFNYIPYISTIDVVPASGPYIVYTSNIVNDASGNNNGLIDYGENILLTVELTNVGIADAINVTTTLSTTCEYIELITDEVNYGNIIIDGSVSIVDGFEFNVSDDIPDYLDVSFQLTSIDETSKEIWESSFTLTSHAPDLDFGSYAIDDASGNNNGRFDPGETIDITIQTLNNGHSPTIEGEMIVSTTNPYVTINTPTIDVAVIDAEGMQEVAMNITIDEEAQIGSLADIIMDYSAGSYTVSGLIQESVGLIMEDFELGDFDQFDWEFNSFPWIIVDGDQAYEGNYAARSATISHNQNSTIELECSVVADGDISFYYKVSSEGNYDKLKFYINNIEQDNWSGEVAWTEVTYAVTAGDNTFKWEYSKDVSVSSGDDCAWIDNIILPAMTFTSVYAGPDTEICENDTFQCAGSATNYISFLWETAGTGVFDDDQSFTPIYTPSEEDIINGNVSLSLNIIDVEEMPLSDTMILSFNYFPAMPAMPVGPELVDLNSVTQSEYTTDIIQFADSYSWSLYPPEAGSILGTDVMGTVNWDMEFVGEAWVKVAGENDCGSGEFSDSLLVVVINSVGIANLQEEISVNIVPNPSTGIFTVAVASSKNSIFDISIINQLGETIIKSETIDLSGSSNKSFEIDNVQAGIYFVIVQNNNSRIVKKLLIKNN